MVRLDLADDDPTGEAGTSTQTPADSPRERGRRRALDIITGGDGEPEAVADGGLHPDTIRWLEANPEADTDAAIRYDRHTRLYRDAVDGGDLSPRGDPGASANWDRAAELNAARKAIREYLDLEARTS